MCSSDLERYKTSASMWRNEAYRLGGVPLPWDADELIEKAVKAEREEFAKHAVDIARRAIAEEREACAKIVEENADRCGVDTIAWMLLSSNAQAIRARGKHER